MCGIAYIKNKQKKQVKKKVKEIYQEQQHRGSEGFGFIEVGNGIKIKRATKEQEILKKLASSDASEIIFHHRYPTSTPNIAEATHPIAVVNDDLEYNYYVIHNGIISNDYELKTKHNELGFNYTTEIDVKYHTSKHIYTGGTQFNDSEALAIDLSLMFEGKKAFEAEGSIAFICLQTTKKHEPVKLFYGRSGNPLNRYSDKNIFILSSEGKGEAIKEGKIFCFDYASDKEIPCEFKIPVEETTKTGFKTPEPMETEYDHYGRAIVHNEKAYNEAIDRQEDYVSQLYEELADLKDELNEELALSNGYSTNVDILEQQIAETQLLLDREQEKLYELY